eukprot:GILI01011146.1.p1 GENE.GILI01011146.1~~GILI01011146.1.p1  ORF type:complete len:350 (-),score=99.97 GILI01011146.1:273-1208(-)
MVPVGTVDSLTMKPKPEPRKCPSIEELLRGISLFVYFLVSVPICLALCVLRITHPLFRLCGVKRYLPTDIVQSMWTKGAVAVMGIRVIVEGKEHFNLDEPTIAFFTHASNADAFILDSQCPISMKFIGKRSLFFIPLIGWLGAGLGHIPINRGRLEDAKKSLSYAGEQIRGGKSVAISPEGTRRRNPSGGPEAMLPFKKGPFHLAKEAGVSITPAILIGVNSLWPPSKAFITPGTVVLRFLPPVPKEVSSLPIEQMMATVREEMLKGFHNLPPRELHKEKPLFNCFVFWCVWIGGFVAAVLSVLRYQYHLF